MPDQAGFHVCGQCGRRVPRSIAVCRCGAQLLDESSGQARQERGSGAASVPWWPSVLVAGLAGAAVAGGVMWVTRPSPDRPPVEVAPGPPSRSEPAPASLVAAPTPSSVAVAPTEQALAPPPPPAPPVERQARESTAASVEEIVARAMPAVVLVETAEGRGSAFFVRTDTLVTNVHVVGTNSSVTIRRPGGRSVPARVEASARQFDLAVLVVQGADPNQPVIPLGSAAGVRPGQPVIAIGSALGLLDSTVTQGIVSAVRQSGAATLVQTDTAVNPGNSGGPLLNRDGVAIGITTMGYSDRQGLNFAVAADHARALIERRPSAVGSSVSASLDLSGLTTGGPSATERTRAEGQRAYQEAMVEAERRARRLDEEWNRFKSLCYSGAVRGGGQREWFTLYEPGGLPGPVAPGCGPLLEDLSEYARGIRDAVLTADEAARRAGVFPGVRRETRERHRLNYPGWDR